MVEFYTASDEEIKKGKTTDVYFQRTKKILKEKNIGSEVVAEISCSSIPEGEYGLLCGIEEAIELLEDRNLDVEVLPEGSFFQGKDENQVPTPLMNIRGEYREFCELETPLLGLLCQASGIATAASRIKRHVMGKSVLAFGVRRMHPAISPMIDKASYLGGFDGVSCVLSAEKLGLEAKGTMPHALILIHQDKVKAWKAFDEIVEENVSRILLCDTFSDEKQEALEAAEAIEELDAIRLDTPGSRRGNFKDIIAEVRWELDQKGYEDVGIFVSGGLNEEKIIELKDMDVEGFGVGTSVSNARAVDMSMNIVEIDGKPVSKRGVFSGAKQLYRCEVCDNDLVGTCQRKCPDCGAKMKEMLEPVIENGEKIVEKTSVEEKRKKVLEYLRKYPIEDGK